MAAKILIVCGPFRTFTARATQNRRLTAILTRLGVVPRVISLLQEKHPLTRTHEGSVEIVEQGLERNLAGYVQQSGSRILWRATEAVQANFFLPRLRTFKRLVNQEIADFSPDACLFIGQPFFVPLLGLEIQTARLKAAFFSDPWPIHGLPAPYARRSIPFASGINERLLLRMFQEYDRLFYTNPNAIEFMLSRHPQIRPYADKISVLSHYTSNAITQPADPSLVEKAANSVVHIGYLGRERITKPLLSAITFLANEKGLKFLFIGGVADGFKQLVNQGAFGDRVTLVDPIPDEQCKFLYRVSRLNLVVEADISPNPFLPSKVIDVVCSSKRFVIVTGATSAARTFPVLDMECLSGHVFTEHDSGQIRDTILNALLEAESSPPLSERDVSERSLAHNRKVAFGLLDQLGLLPDDALPELPSSPPLDRPGDQYPRHT